MAVAGSVRTQNSFRRIPGMGEPISPGTLVEAFKDFIAGSQDTVGDPRSMKVGPEIFRDPGAGWSPLAMVLQDPGAL